MKALKIQAVIVTVFKTYNSNFDVLFKLYWYCVVCVCVFFFFLTHCEACGNLVLWPGIETKPPALETWSFNLWSERETPVLCFILVI